MTGQEPEKVHEFSKCLLDGCTIECPACKESYTCSLPDYSSPYSDHFPCVPDPSHEELREMVCVLLNLYHHRLLQFNRDVPIIPKFEALVGTEMYSDWWGPL